jgi:hypothetical protein
MEYFVFNETNKTLSVRDGFTNLIDRLTLKVKFFEIKDGYYHFEVEKHPKLEYKSLYLPIQNTLLSVI